MKTIKFIYNYWFYQKYLSIIFLICLYRINYFITQKPDNFTIYEKEKFESFYEAFNNAKKFINDNIRGKLIHDVCVQPSKHPKISAIIPCYNCKNYILRAVRSIQNQNFCNIEIIIGNDFSNDDSLSFLNKLKQEDSRIFIINNKKNMGTLYTRSIVALSSKGDYICPIDSDDMILNFNVFSRLNKITEKGKFDFLIFNSIVTNLLPNISFTKIYNHTFEKYHKPNLVLFQPELGYYPIIPTEKSFRSNEVLIFAKFIKSLTYKNALNKLGKKKISRYMILGEDDIANIIIFNTANLAKFIPLYGYLHISRLYSVSSSKMAPYKHLLNNLYILDVLIDFSKDYTKNKLILFKYLKFILTNKNLQTLLYASKSDNNVLISCLDRILNCKLISSLNKTSIKKLVKSLKFIKYNF